VCVCLGAQSETEDMLFIDSSVNEGGVGGVEMGTEVRPGTSVVFR